MLMMDQGLEIDKTDKMELNKGKRLTDCRQVMMFQLTIIYLKIRVNKLIIAMRIFEEGDLIALENRKKNPNQRAESKENTNSEGT
jgi:cytoskeletal protein CcmA (bactofilin family)